MVLVIADQPVPPGACLHEAPALDLRLAQLVHRLLQALGDRGKLPADQRRQFGRILSGVTGRRRAQHVERLKQILDVVRHPGSRLVHGLHIRLLLEFLLADLGNVELLEQLSEQVKVPLQGRAQLLPREHPQMKFLIRVFDRVLGHLPEFATSLAVCQ
jgi:hypothetical protein